MQRLEITAFIKNWRIIINDDLAFDWILYHALSKEILGDDIYYNEYNINREEENSSISDSLWKIIKLHSDEVLESIDMSTWEIHTHNCKNANVYLASCGMYDIKYKIIERIRKRFEELKFERWWKAEKKVYTTMWEYKNYDMVREVILTDKITWVVVWDKEKIEELLSKIDFIWKERNIWYGEVERWEVKVKNSRGWRYFPSVHFAPYEIQEYRRVHPPYHIAKNRLLCSKRYF